MENLSIFNKIVFFFNSVFAFLLCLGYLLPYIPPRIFPVISVLTLVIPVLILINLCFVVYWLLFLKRQFLLSGIILILGLFQNTAIYRFPWNEGEPVIQEIEKKLSILSYNVHYFRDPGKEKVKIRSGIAELIAEEQPDVICFQEFELASSPELRDFPYHTSLKRKSHDGQAIFSKYKIVEEGSLDFPDSGNNGIYADIQIGKDTLRVYNLHMQSLSITPEIDKLQEEASKRLLGRMGRTFKKQQEQTLLFLKHQEKCSYKNIVAGDFNNTVYSYIYQKIRGKKKDAFAKAGSGLGRTFMFDFIPLRIDYILADPEMNVLEFKNFEVNYSDHFPIKAVLAY